MKQAFRLVISRLLNKIYNILRQNGTIASQNNQPPFTPMGANLAPMGGGMGANWRLHLAPMGVILWIQPPWGVFFPWWLNHSSVRGKFPPFTLHLAPTDPHVATTGAKWRLVPSIYPPWGLFTHHRVFYPPFSHLENRQILKCATTHGRTPPHPWGVSVDLWRLMGGKWRLHGG